VCDWWGGDDALIRDPGEMLHWPGRALDVDGSLLFSGEQETSIDLPGLKIAAARDRFA
jgi:hypothetical protein